MARQQRTGAQPTSAAPATPSRLVEVRALRMGYYGDRRRKEGTVFDYALYEGKKLPSWVEPANGEQPSVTAVVAPNAGRTTDSDVI